jgi:predicted TIM-barrel fold metal-dependent hydrolase
MNDEIIDVHVHFGAPKDVDSGCYWSSAFEKGIAYFAMRLITNNLFGKITIQRVKKHLLKTINGSKHVKKTVLLALDQVYDEDGNLCKDKTHLYVPNSYLIDLASENNTISGNNTILFGASIHPYSPDWENELQYCLENNAVLCKWIPSSQQIDPMHPKCLPFYEKLAEYNLPLLCHVGPEAAIPPFDKPSQELNSPRFLRPALDAGVKVIAAHAALPLLPPPLESDQAYQELVALFQEMESKNWQLYTDLSAINLGPRHLYIDKIKEDIPSQCLVFGSDYPIPILDISQKPHLSIWHWLKHFFQTIFIKNPLDKNYALIKNMDFDESLYHNASNILRLE